MDKEVDKSLNEYKMWAARLNLFSLHVLAVFYPLKGLICSIYYFFWSLVWATVHIPDFFIGMWKLLKLSVCFANLFFKFVHTEKFTACGVYASLGAFLVLVLMPNQPLVMVVSSVIFGHIGAGVRHFVLPLFNGHTATR